MDLLSEQDPVALSYRVDTNVKLGLLRMRKERLEDKGVESTSSLLNCAWLASTLLDPFARDIVVLVEAEETSFTSALDELVGLGDKLV